MSYPEVITSVYVRVTVPGTSFHIYREFRVWDKELFLSKYYEFFRGVRAEVVEVTYDQYKEHVK